MNNLFPRCVRGSQSKPASTNLKKSLPLPASGSLRCLFLSHVSATRRFSRVAVAILDVALNIDPGSVHPSQTAGDGLSNDVALSTLPTISKTSARK